jgi:hypothetical protein
VEEAEEENAISQTAMKMKKEIQIMPAQLIKSEYQCIPITTFWDCQNRR